MAEEANSRGDVGWPRRPTREAMSDGRGGQLEMSDGSKRQLNLFCKVVQARRVSFFLTLAKFRCKSIWARN